MQASEISRQAPHGGARPRGRLPHRDGRRLLIGGSTVAVLLAIWQVVGSKDLVPSELISYPGQLLEVGASMAASGGLIPHFLVSLQELVYGFAPAVGVGILLGLLMGHSRRLRYLLDPLTMALYTTPRIALIPMLVLWFGVGMESKIAVVFLGGVFPVLVNTVAGVRQLDRSWIQAVRSFGATAPQVMTIVTLRGALPAIMTGIRLGLGRGILGVIVGEMYVSVAGVGQLIHLYGNAGRAAELMVLITFIAMFGVLCIAMLRRVEEWIGPWPRQREL